MSPASRKSARCVVDLVWRSQGGEEEVARLPSVSHRDEHGCDMDAVGSPLALAASILRCECDQNLCCSDLRHVQLRTCSYGFHTSECGCRGTSSLLHVRYANTLADPTPDRASGLFPRNRCRLAGGCQAFCGDLHSCMMHFQQDSPSRLDLVDVTCARPCSLYLY